MSGFVGCFVFDGKFGGMLQSLLHALLALLILSVMLVAELDLDYVTDLLGMKYFSLIPSSTVIILI